MELGGTVQRCTEMQLILKWGGNLTKLGEKQAVQLGHRHRHDLYPDAPGGGKRIPCDTILFVSGHSHYFPFSLLQVFSGFTRPSDTISK